MLLWPGGGEIRGAFRAIEARGAAPHNLAWDRFLVLLPGMNVLVADRELPDKDLSVRAGSRFRIYLKAAASVRASRPQPSDVVVDGTPITMASNPDRAVLHDLRFTGTAGRWVYPVHGPMPAIPRSLLVSPQARVVPDVARESPETSAGLYHLPATGQHRMLVIRPPGSPEITWSMRSAVALAPLPADGQPVSFAPAAPGQLVVAPVRLGRRGSFRLSASEVTLPGSWTAQAYPNCSPWVGACGEWTGATVTPSQPTSVGLRGRRAPASWLVVLRPPTEGLGVVELALEPWTDARRSTPPH